MSQSHPGTRDTDAGRPIYIRVCGAVFDTRCPSKHYLKSISWGNVPIGASCIGQLDRGFRCHPNVSVDPWVYTEVSNGRREEGL
jgi:hypothetical protein